MFFLLLLTMTHSPQRSINQLTKAKPTEIKTRKRWQATIYFVEGYNVTFDSKVVDFARLVLYEILRCKLFERCRGTQSPQTDGATCLIYRRNLK